MNDDARRRSLRSGADGAVTYTPTGGTLVEPPTAPPGHHLIDQRVAIGRGGRRFEQAATDLADWQVQRGAGVRVVTDGPPTPGRRVTLRVGFGPFRLSAPVVVIGTVNTVNTVDTVAHAGPGGPETVRRNGFAYGTCPGHPESGEEAFLIEMDAMEMDTRTIDTDAEPGSNVEPDSNVDLDGDGVVWLRIVAFSRPATWYARLGGPVARAAQAFITRRYLRALGPRMTS